MYESWALHRIRISGGGTPIEVYCTLFLPFNLQPHWTIMIHSATLMDGGFGPSR